MRRHLPAALAAVALVATAMAPAATSTSIARDGLLPPLTSADWAPANDTRQDSVPDLATAPGAAAVFAPRGMTTDRFEAATTPEVATVIAHDGVELHARVYRPDSSADPDFQQPVVLVHSPYYPAAQGLRGDDARSMDIVEHLTPKGYAVVLSDIRGTGQSGGCLGQDGPDQAQDFVTLVEHFASQPWSNGKVGSYGKSYDAESQNAGAVLRPEGLATMVTVAGISGLYDVYAFDGVPLGANGLLSAGVYTPTGLYAPDSPTRLAQRPGCLAEHALEAANPSGDMNSYWAEREFRVRVRDVQASVLYVHGLRDSIVTPIALDDWYDELPTFKRAVLGQWAHNYSYDAPNGVARDDWYDTIHAWFDSELLGLDTGVEAWPPVQVQSERNSWRAVASFADMGTERTYSLVDGGGLSPGDPATFIPLTTPIALSERGTVAFDTAPFTDGAQLSGQLFVDAAISLDLPDAHFVVTVRETGTNRVLTTGYLSAPHAESLLNQVAPVVGHATPYRIRTYPFDANIAPGNAVRIELSGTGGLLDALPAGNGWTGQLTQANIRLPMVENLCALTVAQRQPATGPVGDCADGIPAGDTAFPLGAARGHVADQRLLGSTTLTIEGIDAVREWGYLTMRDGVELAFEVIRPDDDQPHPTLLTYDGYYAGGAPDSGYARRYLPRGYALAGLQVRGTGCSGGEFDFFQPAEANDGYEAVEHLAAQPWSTGRVALIGKSYPGVTQLFTAVAQPPSLAAITPGHFFADVYRDVAFPGGILNHSFTALWTYVARPSSDFGGAFPEAGTDLFAGEPTCAVHQAHNATGASNSPFVQALQHPYEDAVIRERSPIHTIDRIQVPVFAVTSWQDEQLGSRNTRVLEAFDDLGIEYRAIVGNGDHGMYRDTAQLAELDRFLEAHLEQRGVLRDGTSLATYLDEPRVDVMWEQAGSQPRWRTTLDTWSDIATPASYRLGTGADGTGMRPMQQAETSDLRLQQWLHNAASSQGIGNAAYASGALPDRYLWDTMAPAEGTAGVFTSEPFDRDTALLGTASLDLLFTSTAPNVDLQVTLTEIREDGREVFVQQGWLRTSQRAEDASRSTVLSPYQQHTAHLAAPLSAVEAQRARVEIWPFGHLVREGSRLRVWIEAPTSLPQLWAFTLDPTPSVVTAYLGAGASTLVLPVVDVDVPSEFAGQGGQPDCNTVLRQPCRTDPRG
jgi:putative CocE/NonD family hydrolase